MSVHFYVTIVNWHLVAETTIGLDFRFLPLMAVWLRFMTWYIICHNFLQDLDDPASPVAEEANMLSSLSEAEKIELTRKILRVIHLLSLWPVVFVPAVNYDMNTTLFLLLVVIWMTLFLLFVVMWI